MRQLSDLRDSSDQLYYLPHDLVGKTQQPSVKPNTRTTTETAAIRVERQTIDTRLPFVLGQHTRDHL